MNAKLKISLILSVIILILLAAFTTSHAAQEPVVFTVEKSRIGVAGKNFTIEVSVSDNPGFSRGSFSLSYRKNDLTLVSVELSEAATEAGAKLTKPGKISEYPYNFEISSPSDISVNGVILQLTFKLSSETGLGEYPVDLSIGQNGITNHAGEKIAGKTESGGFSISCIHNYTVTVVKPTCSAEGYTFYKCTECSVSYQDQFKNKLAHTWKTVMSYDPTCTEDGRLERYCTVCKYSETVKNGQALGHSYDKGKVVQSTCLKSGYTLYTCTRCHAQEQRDYQPLAPHTYKESIKKEPTCMDVGYKELNCEVCGEHRTEIMPTVDHDYILTEVHPATHTEKGWTAYKCRFCDYTIKDSYVDPLPYDMHYTTVEPTCTKPGQKIGVCADGCGYRTEEIIPALGHSFGEWKVEKHPGVKEDGLEVRICGICGEREERAISPTGTNAVSGPGTNGKPKDEWADIRQIIVIGAASMVLLFIIVLVVIIGKHRRGKDKNA